MEKVEHGVEIHLRGAHLPSCLGQRAYIDTRSVLGRIPPVGPEWRPSDDRDGFVGMPGLLPPLTRTPRCTYDPKNLNDAGRSAAWLARLPWEQEVTSSNLVAPILDPPDGPIRELPDRARSRPEFPTSGRRRHGTRHERESIPPRSGRRRPRRPWSRRDDRRPRLGHDRRLDGPAPGRAGRATRA